MLRRLRKFLDPVRILDSLRVSCGMAPVATTVAHGIYKETGEPVPVHEIMTAFGVSQAEAERISKRSSR